MEQNTGQLSDYYAIIRRRKMHIIIPLIIILLISIGLAFGLPPVYQSSATILIEQQEIPQELVPSTVNSYAAERIQVISQRVMTRTNLMSIIEKYNLFSDERQSDNADDLITRMRDNIDVAMVSAEVNDPRARQGKATIAFNLTFDSNKQEDAQNVVKELTTLFLDENIRIRTQKAEITSDFLSEEANRLSKEIAGLEARLAEYKEKNVGRLPELMQMNLNLMERTDRELEDSAQKIASLEDNQKLLENQLLQIEPNTSDSPEGRLRKLQSDYLSASAIYSPDHPDLVRMRREIEALKKQTGIETDTAELDSQILKVRDELAAAREKYSVDHPDVIKLEKTLALLKSELKQKQNGSLEIIDIELKPDNPAYISAMNQLESIKLNIKAEKERQARLKEKYAEYEERLTQMPRVEQEGLTLKRDYDNAVQKFHEIKQKQLQAQVGEQLERESKGERFSLIDPPSYPTQPIKPNRPGILLLGVVLSMSGGMGLAAMSEFLDQTVRGAKAVTGLLKAPPLSMIPYIENSKDRRRKRRKSLIVVGLIIAIILVLFLFIYFFWLPMDA